MVHFRFSASTTRLAFILGLLLSVPSAWSSSISPMIESCCRHPRQEPSPPSFSQDDAIQTRQQYHRELASYHQWRNSCSWVFPFCSVMVSEEDFINTGGSTNGIFKPVAARASSLTVVAPCREKSTDPAYLRRCTDVLNGVTGGTGVVEAMPGALKQLEKQFKDEIETAYKTGVFNDTSVDPENPSTYSFPKPACSYTKNMFTNNVDEIATNHLGETCGAPVGINVNVSVKTRGVRFGYFCDKGDEGVSRTLDMRGGKGILEKAYYGGAIVQAFSCYFKQVTDEISKPERKFKVSTACKAAAEQVTINATQTAKTAEMIGGLQTGTGAAANVADILNCESQFGNGKFSAHDSEKLGSLRQSAQQLCAARMALENSFTQLLRCEIAARANTSVLLSVGSFELFSEQLKTVLGGLVNAECEGQCAEAGGKSPFNCDPNAYGPCGSECANSAGRFFNVGYPKRLKQVVSAGLQANWPVDGSCSDVTGY